MRVNNAAFAAATNYEMTARLNMKNVTTTNGVGIIGYFDPVNIKGYVIRFRRAGSESYCKIEKIMDSSNLETLDTCSFIPPQNDWFNIKAQYETMADKTIIRMKVWAAGTTEPTTWTKEVNDLTIVS